MSEKSEKDLKNRSGRQTDVASKSKTSEFIFSPKSSTFLGEQIILQHPSRATDKSVLN